MTVTGLQSIGPSPSIYAPLIEAVLDMGTARIFINAIVERSQTGALLLSFQPCHRNAETRIGAAVWVPDLDRATVHPPGYLDKAPVSRVEREEFLA
jgi:hypothetical protein